MNSIRKYRLKAGLTQLQLAKSIGKTIGCISQYESGHHQMPVPVARKVAKIVGCEWSDLYEEDDDGTIGDG